MKRMFLVIAGIIVFSLAVVSCSLPASSAPQTVPTNTPNVPFPVATNAQAVHDIVSGTQTAMALGGSPLPTQQLPTFSVASTNLPTFPALTTGTLNPLYTSNPVTVGTPWATSTPGKPATYAVHEGEFCYCLARRFNVNPDTLISLNAACSSAALQPGASISIPATGSWPGDRALKQHPTTYTVRSGDTIYTIACYFGDVDPNVIIAANGLVSPYTLTVGKVLQIP